MPGVDIYLVNVEDSPDFTEDSGASGLDTISAEDRIDVVRANRPFIDKRVGIAACELPQAGDIGAIGG